VNRLHHLCAALGIVSGALGSAATWWTVSLRTGAEISVTGVQASALLWSIGAVVVAAYGLLFVLRGLPRRGVAAVQALAGGFFAAVAFHSAGDPVPSALTSVTALTGVAGVDAVSLVVGASLSGWHYSAVVAGVLLSASGVGAVVAAEVPRKMSRFERGGSEASLQDDVSAWDALSDGVDPTQR